MRGYSKEQYYDSSGSRFRMVCCGRSGESGACRARRVAAQFRFLCLSALVILSCFMIFVISNFSQVKPFIETPIVLNNLIRPAYHDTFTINTEGCTIPALQAFDESVIKFFRRPVEVKQCPFNQSNLLINNSTHIWIERDNFPYHNLSDNANVCCCYRAFYRSNAIEDIYDRKIDDRVKYLKCIKFRDSIEAKHEFIRITCRHHKKQIADQFFLYAMKKQKLANILKFEDSSLSNQSAYNVVMLGIDAVSRLNFHRTMPKTLSFLQEKGAVELLGYNKVGDNTFPNLIPMLLGIKSSELKNTCLPHWINTFDNCPFIWERFKEAGYFTALGEDSASLGTFNYARIGFASTPTDYYLHTFISEAEKIVGNNKDMNSKLCMGNKYFYNVILDYLEDLILLLSPFKFFGFFWEVTMSHDYVHYPTLIDDDYESFLQRLDVAGALDNTVMMLVSDHGIRWGGIRATKQGRLEERLPFLYILMPSSFRNNYYLAYQNLKANSYRLTTPFDVHETLTDLINIDVLSDAEIALRSRKQYADERGISLFLPIPKNRTCNIAGIDDHWCTCHTGVKIAITSPEALNASSYLVVVLNALVHGYRSCARLHLEEIMEASEMNVGMPDKNESGWREFMVVVRTRPGDAIFEGTVRRDAFGGFSLAGSISRLNLYGDQSKCVHDSSLKLYCYCI